MNLIIIAVDNFYTLDIWTEVNTKSNNPKLQELLQKDDNIQKILKLINEVPIENLTKDSINDSADDSTDDSADDSAEEPAKEPTTEEQLIHRIIKNKRDRALIDALILPTTILSSNSQHTLKILNILKEITQIFNNQVTIINIIPIINYLTSVLDLNEQYNKITNKEKDKLFNEYLETIEDKLGLQNLDPNFFTIDEFEQSCLASFKKIENTQEKEQKEFDDKKQTERIRLKLKQRALEEEKIKCDLEPITKIVKTPTSLDKSPKTETTSIDSPSTSASDSKYSPSTSDSSPSTNSDYYSQYTADREAAEKERDKMLFSLIFTIIVMTIGVGVAAIYQKNTQIPLSDTPPSSEPQNSSSQQNLLENSFSIPCAFNSEINHQAQAIEAY